MNLDLSLYVLTDPLLSRGRSHFEVVKAALAGGATSIQFRDKNLGTRAFLEVGGQLRHACRVAGVSFIVNDRLDLALALEADGVHLGPDDLPPPIARRLVGPDFIMGVSVDNVEEALQAVAAGATYLGAGPVFPTRTKLNTGPVMGLEGLARIVKAVPVPVVGIGSIKPANLARVIATGAAGAAVISAAVGAEDIQGEVAGMAEIIRQTRAKTQGE